VSKASSRCVVQVFAAIISPLAASREGVERSPQVQELTKGFRSGAAISRGFCAIFDKIKDDFLSAIQGVYRLMPPLMVSMAVQMGARSIADKDSVGWIADKNGISVPSLNRTRQSRRNEAKVGSVHVVVISALFLVLFAATLMVGGHAAIDPLVQAATELQDPRSASAVVYTMPDGIFCRRVSFDNVTAQVTEGSIERCSTDATIARARARPNGAFAWRNN
jgi:hypothetical protein